VRRLRVAAIAALLAARATAAGAQAPPPAAHDDLGRLVRLAHPARRVIALSPQLAELAAAAGAPVVGTVRGADAPAVLPRVGDAFALNLEAIALLHPDLILAWRSGTPPRQRDALAELGVPLFWAETTRLEQIAADVRRIGRLAGDATRADAWADGFDARLAALRARYAARTPVRVFYQTWARPLMTVGGPQLINQAVALCGGVNPFARLAQPAPAVSREAVLAADPQLIVDASPDAHALDDWRRFPQLAAVRDGGLVRLDADALPRMGVHVLDGVDQLCRAIDAVRRRAASARQAGSHNAAPSARAMRSQAQP
jgi:iron complex transport system substrate-binding protein